jgi:hypothetical protein
LLEPNHVSRVHSAHNHLSLRKTSHWFVSATRRDLDRTVPDPPPPETTKQAAPPDRSWAVKRGPDVIVAAVMAMLALQGAATVIRQAEAELRSRMTPGLVRLGGLRHAAGRAASPERHE